MSKRRQNINKCPLSAAVAASHEAAVAEFISDHATEIAREERKYRTKPGDLLGAAWLAAQEIAAGNIVREKDGSVIRLTDPDAVHAITSAASNAECRRYAAPTGTGHGSQHSYGVQLDDSLSAAIVQPDFMIEVEQRAKALEKENAYYRECMREAQRNDSTPPSEYRGQPIPLRSLERHRAQARIAKEHGQLEFFQMRAAGWETALDETCWDVARAEAIAATLEAEQPAKRSLIYRVKDRIVGMVEAVQLAFHGTGFDLCPPGTEPHKGKPGKVTHSWRKHRLAQRSEPAMPAGWHAMQPSGPLLEGGRT